MCMREQVSRNEGETHPVNARLSSNVLMSQRDLHMWSAQVSISVHKAAPSRRMHGVFYSSNLMNISRAQSSRQWRRWPCIRFVFARIATDCSKLNGLQYVWKKWSESDHRKAHFYGSGALCSVRFFRFIFRTRNLFFRSEEAVWCSIAVNIKRNHHSNRLICASWFAHRFECSNNLVIWSKYAMRSIRHLKLSRFSCKNVERLQTTADEKKIVNKAKIVQYWML